MLFLDAMVKCMSLTKDWYGEKIVENIISGGAIGVDTMAEKYAKARNIKFTCFLPDWQQYGKGAGIRRNKAMVDYGVKLPGQTIILSIWDGSSKGTKHTINYGLKNNLKVYMYNNKDKIIKLITEKV